MLLTSIAVGQIQEFRGTFTGDDFPFPTSTQATGECIAFLDLEARTLTIHWSVTNLSGNPAVPGMHVHNAPVGEIGNILFVITNTVWPTTGSVVWEGVQNTDIRELRNERLYVNMHTSSNPTNGEVRAQLIRVFPCQADVNGDGVADNGDIIAFVNTFLAGDLAADFNSDGVLDNGDIIAFVDVFLAGCSSPIRTTDPSVAEPAAMPWDRGTLPIERVALDAGLTGIEGRRPVCDCGCDDSIAKLATMDPASMTQRERARAAGAGLLPD